MSSVAWAHDPSRGGGWEMEHRFGIVGLIPAVARPFQVRSSAVLFIQRPGAMRETDSVIGFMLTPW